MSPYSIHFTQNVKVRHQQSKHIRGVALVNKNPWVIYYFTNYKFSFNGCHSTVYQHRGICIYVYNTTKFVKILTIFYFSLMHGDMFRLFLQPSSGQLVVQIRYKWCAYNMGSHKVYICSTSEVKYTMEC